MADDVIDERKRLRGLIADENWSAVASSLPDLHAADIADLIENSASDARERLFALVDDTRKHEVLAELEGTAEDVITAALSDAELSDLVEEMSPDDAADILAELPEHRSSTVLDLMPEDESDEVRHLLTYDPETAGGIMTTDLIAMKEDQSVQEALQAITSFDEPDEHVYYAHVVDETGMLTGYVDIWELLRAKNQNRLLGDIAHRDFTSVDVTLDQEQVAHIMSQYDLDAVPVIDQDGKLVGRITADDVIDVIREEATEDILKLAGSRAAELESDSAIQACRSRMPWLLVTLAGSCITSVILKQFQIILGTRLGFEQQVDVNLIAFIPIVLAMAGNAGIQSSTLMVRSIALGLSEGHSARRLLRRELIAGSLMGTLCGLLIGGWALILSSGDDGTHLPPMELALVVTIALFSAMTFATMFGTFLPTLLNRLRIDPAVASGPFVTISNDIIALLIYFAVLIAMLG